jgi:hypothetical protein
VQNLIAEAFLFLHLVMGMPAPARMPQFIPATEGTMPCRNCAGFYRRGVIWVRWDRPHDANWRGILVHEAAHHLQREMHGDAADCTTVLLREDAALLAQRRYVEREGSYFGQIPAAYQCIDSEGLAIGGAA